MNDTYSLELLEMDVSEQDVPVGGKPVTATYMVALVRETQWRFFTTGGTWKEVWVGTIWCQTFGYPMTLKNGRHRYTVDTEEEAYEWWRKATANMGAKR